MPKKHIIISVVSREEAKNAYFKGKFQPGLDALAKKHPGSIIIEYDPKIGFTEEQTKNIQLELKEVDHPPLFYIVAHATSSDNNLFTQGHQSIVVTPKKFAKDFSDAIGGAESSIDFSLIACYGTTVAKNLQAEFLKKNIATTIKTRTRKVGIDIITGKKGTRIHGEAYAMKAPGSKIILYVDERGQQKIWDYKYSDKKLYTESYAIAAIENEDSKSLNHYLNFEFIKHRKIRSASVFLKLAINSNKIISLTHLLGSKYIRDNLTTLLTNEQYQKLKTLIYTSRALILKEAILYGYIEVIKLLENQDPTLELTPFIEMSKMTQIVFEARRVRDTLHQEILDLKLSKEQSKTLTDGLEKEYQESNYQNFYNKYHGKSLVEYAILNEKNELLKHIILQSTLEEKSIENENRSISLLFFTLIVGSLDSFKIIFNKNINLLTKYPIPYYSGEELTLYEYALQNEDLAVSQYIIRIVQLNESVEKLITNPKHSASITYLSGLLNEFDLTQLIEETQEGNLQDVLQESERALMREAIKMNYTETIKVLAKLKLRDINKIIVKLVADVDEKLCKTQISAKKIKNYINSLVTDDPEKFVKNVIIDSEAFTTQILEELVKREHLENLEKLKLYIIYHDFKASRSSYYIDINPGGKGKQVPKTVYDHWEILTRLSEKNSEEIYSEIISTAQKAKQNPPTFFRRSPDTIEYLRTISEESFEFKVEDDDKQFEPTSDHKAIQSLSQKNKG